MAPAKIEPGETDISLAGRETPRKQPNSTTTLEPHSSDARKPSPKKKKNDQAKASPLDRGIDLGE